ncbi:DUF2474 domain-containing protein [Massilia sp. 9096]|uniref:DUF2474 domain-containing protein n=1 Tax=Massilia sp. 9096 TaxID=1500894 RepID=UPI0027D819AD|nr:DUF2474 domain-containing protein [Massilia sp. 9096]
MCSKGKLVMRRLIIDRWSGYAFVRRLAWLVGIWLASVASLAGVATVLRLLMHAAGMRSP